VVNDRDFIKEGMIYLVAQKWPRNSTKKKKNQVRIYKRNAIDLFVMHEMDDQIPACKVGLWSFFQHK
jgi:hypothetical protein